MYVPMFLNFSNTKMENLESHVMMSTWVKLMVRIAL